MKISARLFMVSGIAASCGLLFILFVLYSHWGVQWLYAYAENELPESISIKTVSGRLAGSIIFQNLSIATADAKIDVDRAEAKLGLFSLLAGRFHLKELQVNNVVYRKREYSNQQIRSSISAGGVTSDIEIPEISLPVALQLDSIVVRDIQYRVAEAEPVIINELVLSAYTSKSTLNIKKIQINSPKLTASLSGSIELTRKLQSEIIFSWAMQNADFPRLSGKGLVKGDIDSVLVEHELSDSVESTLTARIENLISDPQWLLSADINKVDFSAWGIQQQITSLRGKIESQGRVNDFNVSAKLTKLIPEIGILNTDLVISKQGSLWSVNKLLVKNQDDDHRAVNLGLSGEIILGEQGEFDFQKSNLEKVTLNTNWKNIRWPVSSGDLIKSDHGTLKLAGRFDNFQFSLKGQLEGKHIPESLIETEGNGTLDGLDIQQFSANVLSGQLRGKGQYQWLPYTSWKLDLQANDINPGLKWADYSGNLDVQMKTAGSLKSNQYYNELDISKLSGQFQGRSLEGLASIKFERKQIDINYIKLTSGKSRVNIKGNLSENWSLTSNIYLDDLSQFLPDVKGSVTLNGNIKGPRKKPEVELNLSAELLQYKKTTAREIEADINVDLSDTNKSAVVINIRDIDFNGKNIDTLQLNATGLLYQHNIGLYLVSKDANAELEFTAGLNGGVWKAKLQKSNFQQGDIGRWVLSETSEVKLDQKNIELGKTCWFKDKSTICVQLSSIDGNGRARIELTQLPLSASEPFVREDIQLDGYINGYADFNFVENTAKTLSVRSDLKLSAGKLSYIDKDTLKRYFEFNSAQFNLILDQSGLQAETAWKLQHSGLINAKLKLPDWQIGKKKQDQKIMGNLHLMFPDLSFLPTFINNIGKTKGSLSSDIVIGGSLKSPALTGGIEFNDGSVDLPQAGIIISDIRFSASSSNGKRIDLLGHATSKGGQVSLDGYVDLPKQVLDTESDVQQLDVQQHVSASVSLVGKDFEIINLTEANLYVSPDMQIQFNNDRVDILGVLHIPKARITPKDVSETIPVSDDIVIVGKEIENNDKKIKIFSSVRIEAGEDVRFTGFKIDAFLEGAVVAFDGPDSETTGYGEIKIRNGKYTAYGEELILEDGKLDFKGSLISNPTLKVRAVKKLKTIVVGVNVGGTLTNPVLSLFSQPPTNEENILSYLLLGVPANEASSEGGKSLVYASVLKKLDARRNLGLDEIRLDTSESGSESSVVLGKYLSPKLYVNYSVISGAVDVFLLRYTIGTKWILQSETGEYDSADFLYTYEH